LLASGLFWGHVRNGSDRTARISKAGGAPNVLSVAHCLGKKTSGEGKLGQAKIQNFYLISLRNENIRGLDVAMDYALGMGGVKRVSQLNA
jgi:hypothetical protein